MWLNKCRMKRHNRVSSSFFSASILVAMLLVGGINTHAAEQDTNVDDLYIQVYNTILGADEAWQMGKKREAWQLYQQAQNFLKDIKTQYPNWNQKLIDFRLSYIDAKLEQFADNEKEILENPVHIDKVTTNDATSKDLSAQEEIEKLHTQVAQLQSIRTELEKRLKEATSAQPATSDPEQLAKAEKTIAELTQINTQLQTQLSQFKELASAKNLDTVQKEIDFQTTKQLENAQEQINQLKQQVDSLKKENQSLQNTISTSSSQKTPSSVAEKAVELEKQLNALKKENSNLQAKIDTQDKVIKENEKLQESTNEELNKLRLSTAQLEDDLKNTRQMIKAEPTVEQSDLERLKSRISTLENSLSALDAENKILRNASSSRGADRVVKDIDRLRSKIAIYERNKEPYSPEELALMQPGKPIRIGATLDNATSSNESENSQIRQDTLRYAAPKEGKEIAAEGVKEFAAGHMNEAERLFQRLLSMDENNVYTLGNLGAAQLELNKLQEAEINLKKAYSIDPTDTYVLNLLAILNLKNEKIDDAFELLCSSAKIDPNNAETQNYLGMVLGERGLRADAEKAFRSAVKIDPNYLVAHYNLAVLYATTKPAYPRLANYHYQKAISLGASPNPEFEKTLQESLDTVEENNTQTK